MTEEEFVHSQIALGRRIHQHDGIFWDQVYPFYCKPAFIFKSFNPGEAKPAWSCSLIGYSHQVLSPRQGNRTVSFMVIDRDGLEGFGLYKLPSKKRNNVRRALENCVIRPIDDIENQLERIREINIAQAIRQEERAGAETPVHRYTVEADRWRQQIRHEFALKSTEWWGAFVGGVLAAYLRTYQVDRIQVILQTKADTAYMKFYPMDALYFTVLSKAATDPSCERVINGSPLHPSLNHFKEQFLFRAVEYPYYSSNAWLVEAAKRLVLARLRHSQPALGNKGGGAASSS